MEEKKNNQKLFVSGDLNGFFGLMFDNLTVLSFLAGIMIFAFKYPADIVYTKMFPGTAFGVLVGDLIYAFMAIKLARKRNDGNVTAMPLGLDTPSTIGIALIVLGPAFIGLKAQGMPEREAAMMTWYIGMATMVMIGLIKVIFSFFGEWVQKIVPQSGLLGSLAGIGLALIGFLPLIDIFGLPIVGMVSLGIILYNLIARIHLPKRLPGVFTAVFLGTAIYYILGPMGLTGGNEFSVPSGELHFGFPVPSLGFVYGFIPALKYLPIAFPFAVLTVIGGINVTESARIGGDDYNTRSILLTEAFATLIAGVFGGVAQSTPYIGQPAYKAMGSRIGYVIMTGLFVGLGGILGYVSYIVELIPKAVLAPILIFVALDIMVQAFAAVPVPHMPAVAFSYFPSVARLIQIKLSNPEFIPLEKFNELLLGPATSKTLPEMLVIVALGNGFILTAMLWGGFVSLLIDRHLKKASAFCIVLALLTFFGIIHSANPDGNMYLPWTLNDPFKKVPYLFTASYLILAAMFYLFSFSKESKEIAEDLGH